MSPAQDVLLTKIQELAREAAESNGVEIVEVILRRQGKHSVLRIDIDRPGPAGVGLAECEAVSRTLGPGLDALDGLPESYDLQISSPGLERPIRTSDDVRRNTGRRVVVETREPVEGARVLRGELRGELGGVWRLALDDGREVAVPAGAVQLARQDLDPPASPGKRRR